MNLQAKSRAQVVRGKYGLRREERRACVSNWRLQLINWQRGPRENLVLLMPQ